MQAAKPAFASMERRERFREIFGTKIRPHPFGEMQFGVSALPKQEVGQPLLAAGADDEIDVAKPGFAGDQRAKLSRVSSSSPAALAAAFKIASRAE